MAQSLNRLKETASQTAGPYVHIGLTPNFCNIEGIYPDDLGISMLTDRTKGDRITIKGRVIDGGNKPLTDAVIEIWQADAAGLYAAPNEPRGDADPTFTGWGRCPADGETGEFRFETIKPGRVPMRDGRMQAPHVSFWIVARGINLGLNTRMYFSDESEANGSDPILARIEHRARVSTLIGVKDGSTYTFDIHLQGANETVFFDI
jgi:protocatechuate 3,4-dioxygenase alpha subunit